MGKWMNYEEFITEIKKYWDLYDKGLKKQANSFLFKFTAVFKRDVSEMDADRILFRFCQEYIDELKFPDDRLERRHLPFQITELLNSYLKRECAKNKMPQLRWMFEIFGYCYNPHNTEGSEGPYQILERAYVHPQCDPKTVELYFKEQLHFLWWGQHHFSEYCLITRTQFEHIVQTANKILLEKPVKDSLVEEFHYYVKLYQLYFEWEREKEKTFSEVCRINGLNFREAVAFYYSI